MPRFGASGEPKSTNFTKGSHFSGEVFQDRAVRSVVTGAAVHEMRERGAQAFQRVDLGADRIEVLRRDGFDRGTGALFVRIER